MLVELGETNIFLNMALYQNIIDKHAGLSSLFYNETATNEQISETALYAMLKLHLQFGA